MAKTTSKTDDLFQRLRAQGLRKRTAKLIADATNRGNPPKRAEKAVSDLKRMIGDVEDRISGGPAKRKAAAQKAANTRKRNAQKRSAAAKKGARTRAKSS